MKIPYYSIDEFKTFIEEIFESNFLVKIEKIKIDNFIVFKITSNNIIKTILTLALNINDYANKSYLGVDKKNFLNLAKFLIQNVEIDIESNSAKMKMFEY